MNIAVTPATPAAPAAPAPGQVATINLVDSWERPFVALPVFAGAQVTPLATYDEALSTAVTRSAGAAAAQGIFMRVRDGVHSYELRPLETVDFTMDGASLGSARRGLELLGRGHNPSLRDTSGRVISSNASIGTRTDTQPLRTEFGVLVTLVDDEVRHNLQMLDI